MKKFILAAIAALTLSAGAASAATNNGQLFAPSAGYTQGGSQ